MRLRLFAVWSAVLLTLPATAAAQDFGVLNSAETINRGNFKLTGAPIVTFGKEGADDDVGVSVSGGYGFTESFDVEGRISFFDGVTYVGGDAEYWLLKDRQVDMSVALGFHVGRGDEQFDTNGFDVTFLASKEVRPRLDLYGALDIAVNNISEDFIEGDYTTVHLVPGLEYSIAPDIDLVAEFGIGLNDDSYHYVAGGIAFYFR